MFWLYCSHCGQQTDEPDTLMKATCDCGHSISRVGMTSEEHEELIESGLTLKAFVNKKRETGCVKDTW